MCSMRNTQPDINKPIQVRFTPMEFKQIDQAIREGYAFNRCDFVRDAVRERLRNMDEVEVKS